MNVPTRGRLARCIAVAVVVAFAGCSTPPPLRPGPLIADQTESTGTSVIARTGQSFLNEVTACTATPAPACSPPKTWQQGRAFLELTCSGYMDRVGNGAQNSSFARKETALTGGFVAGALALAEKSAKTVGTVATLFTFAEASQDAWAASYLFAPGSNSVAILVSRAQASYLDAAKTRATAPDLTFDQAIELLTGYEELCRPARIRGLVDDAIVNAQIKADSTTDAVNDLDVQELLTQLRAVLGGQTVSEQDAIELFIWYGGTGKASAKVLQSLKDKGFVASAEELTKSRSKSILGPVFARVLVAGSPIYKRWQAAIAALSDDKSAAVAPPVLNTKITLRVLSPTR